MRTFSVSLESMSRGRVRVSVPFDPNDVWGAKGDHHIRGTVGGWSVRGTIVFDGDTWSFSLGPAWLRDCTVTPGDHVIVAIEAEGPQRSDLASDLVAAFAVHPEAGAFFDSLAQFYRKAYLRWIDATTRQPHVRDERIAAVVALLRDGVKEQPKE